MSFRSWFDSPKRQRSLASLQKKRRAARRHQPASSRLAIESLEDRSMMTTLFSIGSVTILEGNVGAKNAAVTVNVSGAHGKVSVDYRTANGTATAGSDYNAFSGTLTFAKNQTSKTILIPVIGDRVPESNEAFFVNLQNAKGGRAQIVGGAGTVTIQDNEPRISVSDLSQVEGQSGATAFNFTVSLSAAYDQPVTINYSTADGSVMAGADFTAASGSVVFAAGETSKTIPVLVNGNRLPESDRSFYVNVSTPNSYAEITKAVGVGAIADDEPRISISNASGLEAQSGATAFNFTVSLSTTYDVPVTVNYTTVDGSAEAGIDYTAASGSVVFAPGDTSKTIPVLVNGNPTADPDRTFFVNVSSPNSYAEITSAVGVGAIIDRAPRISIGDAYNYYGETSFTFVVSLSVACDQEVTVNFATNDGTAFAGVHYVATSGMLTFAPGETTKTITVDVLDPYAWDIYLSVLITGVSTNVLTANGSANGYLYYYYYYDPGYYDPYCTPDYANYPLCN